MLKGFRDFILRGNVLDLAVAVVIGAAFSAIVNSLVKDLITPLISAIVKVPNFSYLVLNLNGAHITYGNFLDNTISFLLIAASVYFLVVLPINTLLSRMKLTAPKPATKACPECLSDIPAAAKRCSHCGEPVPVAA
ncbi:Large-conductance mechanosensitive channel [Acidisarcina polymorpha]|uniref:Large-conductance mechanosensitive channel n=1 Tax=Acidisarcina polymorpha TaxID=2211140 RepID=A0A2Z5GB92_9BACT|nr:large conductance mechanosensitive channel protein MscL [Acidisarcina polymorpha]AXC15906.1 Large-conductance mechanosensitive channel [Acidisarcina polymorpha]